MRYYLSIPILLFFLLTTYSQEVSQFKLAKEMQIAYEQKDWESAHNASSQLTSLNPTKGRYWFGLGESAYNLKKYDEALIAYHKSVELGHWNTWAAYNIACIYSLKGEVESAVKWINKAVEWGYKNYDWMKKDEDLLNIQDHPGFLKLYGEPVQENIDRISGWRHDLMFINDRAKTLHYNLYDKITPEQWETGVKSIYDNIPFLNDEEIVMEMMKLVAMIGDGHTSLYPPSEDYGAILSFHKLPVTFEPFKDGIFITSAEKEHEDLIGARAISVGNKTMEELLNRAGEYLGQDNKMGIKRLGPIVLEYSEFYYGEGVSDSNTDVQIKVETKDGIKSVDLKAFDKNGKDYHKKKEKWAKLNSETQNPIPLWLQDNENKFWYKLLPDQKLVYFQYNSIGDKEEQSFEDFNKELYQFISENDVDYLAIDLRHNGGGNSYLNRFLLQTLYKLYNINKMEHLFVLIGRETFSAAQNLTTDLDYRVNAIFVGEPTASKPNTIGETNRIKLPYSGMTVALSDRYHQGGASNSRDYRTWIAPDVLVEVSSEDYKNNIDPVMDTITKFIDVKFK